MDTLRARSTVLALILVPVVALGQIGGGGSQPRSPDSGMPHAWEAGLAVNPFTTVNLYNGNACTVIHLVTIDPVGPALSFSLIHNASAAAATGSSGAAPWGFELGKGWRPSYSANIIRDDTNNKATLIEDDGNEWVFTLSGGVYSAPNGRFDILTRTTSPDEFTLVGPDLTVRVFELISSTTTYRLNTITDADGNTLTVAYTTGGKIDYIKSAADGLTGVGDHRLQFTYDSNGRLVTLEDVIGREWTFGYDTASTPRLNDVNFPGTGTSGSRTAAPDADVEITSYDSSNRILVIQDRENHSWDLAYTSGMLTLAKDPAAGTGLARFEQSFSYPGSKQEGYWRTTVTDRRGKNWQFDFDDSANLRRTADPLGLAANPKYYRTYTYDTAHNLLTVTDELGEVWTATYGSVGNIETLTGPELAAHSNAQQEWEADWEQPDPTNKPNFWRLTQVTDPAGHWVAYGYSSTGPVHQVTTITEMADGVSGSESNSAGVTTIEYSTAARSNGHVSLVSDANDVQHKFDYDKWGYMEKLTEGLIQQTGLPEDVYPCEIGPNTNDAAGGTIQGGGDGGDGGNICLFSDDTTCSEICIIPQGSPSGKPLRLGTVPSPHPTEILYTTWTQCLTSATYDRFRRPLTLDRCLPEILVPPDGEAYETAREHTIAYDNLGRPTSHVIESSGGITRTLSASYLKTGGAQEPAGPSFITAPDGQDIAYTYDELGRVSSVTGGTSYDMFASVSYDKVGRVKEVTRGFSTDATKTVYVYDEAGRTTEIRHETIVGPSTLHQTTYTWNINNTLASRVETDNFGLTVATVAFTYDNRDRLIREEREQAYNGGSAATAYDYRYGYDQLGNRKWRIDAATSERPAYYYTYLYDTDVDPDELDWPTRNNRLLKYDIRKDSSSGDLLRTVSYTYYKTGHASNITVKDWYVDSSTTPGSAGDYDWYHDLALYYFTNGSLRLAMSDKWKLDGQGAPTNYTSLTAREFRYDGIGIARYLAVDYDTNNEPTDPSQWTLVGSPMLTDYAGSMPLTDSSIAYSTSYSATAQTRYFAGDGRQSLGSGGTVAALRYFHGDLIESRVMATDDTAAAVATTAYTAFGEAVPPIGTPARPADPSTLDTRYQYAGSWGYEAGMLGVGGPNSNLAPIALSHVGARWYQLDIGRFMQRDPLGILDSFNVYGYCHGNPVDTLDETGCYSNPIINFFIRSARGWKQVSRGQAVKRASRRGDVRVNATDPKQVAKGVAKDAWPGKDIVHHGPHGEGWMPHWQVQGGGWGHIFYQAIDCVIPPVLYCPSPEDPLDPVGLMQHMAEECGISSGPGIMM